MSTNIQKYNKIIQFIFSEYASPNKTSQLNENEQEKIEKFIKCLEEFINNLKPKGGARKKKRTMKKGGRPKRKQSKTRKSRK